MATNICAELTAGITTRSADETKEVAAALAATLPPDIALAMHGDLGAGKTTFVQGLARGFGILDSVTSPTFQLYTIHRGPERMLVHFDAYRLRAAREAGDLLIEDFLVSPWCLAVEWPENVAAWLPPQTWHLDLALLPDGSHTLRLRA